MSLRSLAVVALAVLVGCSNPYDPNAKKKTGKKGSQTSGGTDAIAGELVENIFRGLSATSGSVDLAGTARQLNEALEQRREKMPEASADLRERIAKSGFANLETVDSREFRPSDVGYLSDTAFCATLAQAFRREGEDDLATARRVFAWVMRNVQLAPNDAAAGGTPFYICFRGTGIVGERAWVFLELLRQLDISGGVVGGLDKPTGDATGAVVAVFGKAPDKNAYLFDVEAGFPIPVAPGGAKPLSTLAEVVAKPSYWRKLKGLPENAPPPKPALFLAVDGEALSSRMALLQGLLVSEAKGAVAVDWAVWKARAEAVLSGVPNSAGADGWSLPARMRAAMNNPQKAMEMNRAINQYWVVNRDGPRMLHLQGNWNLAAKKFITYDFEKSGSQLSLELSGVRMPPEQRQRIETQTRQDIVFFGGTSQLDRADASPAVARSWFERYIKQFSAVGFTPETLRNPSLLCERLVVESGKPGPAKRVWDLLTPEQKKRVQASAGFSGAGRGAEGENAKKFGALLQELTSAVEETTSDDGKNDAAKSKRAERLAEIHKRIEAVLPSVPGPVATSLLKGSINRMSADIEEKGANNARRELQTELKVVQQKLGEKQGDAEKAALEGKSVLVEVLNDLVKRRDFANQEDFGAVAANASEQIRKLFAADRAKLSDADLQTLNRSLLISAFGNELDSAANTLWIPNAIRNAAVCAFREGKPAEAIAILKTDNPALAPAHRAEHAALRRLFESDPKAVVE